MVSSLESSHRGSETAIQHGRFDDLGIDVASVSDDVEMSVETRAEKVGQDIRTYFQDDCLRTVTEMPRPPKYTNDELLNEIRRLADELDRRPPLKWDMNAHGKHGTKTYQDRWGSWSNAVEAAGSEPRSQGTQYEERPDACPLCGVEQSGLDFHHWRYGENEVGCYLCRDCHDDIHQGDAKIKNPGWLVPCVKNPVELHLEYHPDNRDVDQIVNRYSLPDIADIVKKAVEK